LNFHVIYRSSIQDSSLDPIFSTGGEFVYPLVESANEKAKVYLFSQAKGSAFSMKFYQKLLILTHDENGIVTEVNYTSSGTK
jgi:hypothetical protein